ncbi:glutathione S-transferase family protein [Maritalea porphyrae]|uniref:glutathione S-transferase family protein n=1 Tax=Maritalea porphyrae TaxID=880732 RepID=UPI0022B01D2E|nr:glutathione S-transferase family protein [Maritalea porphyrae]MCZ4274134.1 glutathione S-transferase family protein [Maritalea porphyrae]
MTLKVYSFSGAPSGWRVLLALEFKQLSYELHYLDGSKGEHRTAQFRQLNPHSKVPVIVSGGIARRESLALMGWLDRQFPDRPLFGTSATEVARVWETATLFNDYLFKATSAVTTPVFGSDSTPPAANSEEAKSLESACDLLKVEYALLEETLGTNTFLCGEKPSAVDAVVYPDVARIMRAQQTKPDVMKAIGLSIIDEQFPELGKWCRQIQNLPGFENTCPPHWRAAVAA